MNSSAIARRDTIILHDELLSGPFDRFLTVLSHELGHILHGHTGTSVVRDELEANRTASHLLGSIKPIKDLCRYSAGIFEENMLSSHLPENTWLQRIGKKTVRGIKTLKRNQSYGNLPTNIKT